jgi:hypothetical protein
MLIMFIEWLGEVFILGLVGFIFIGGIGAALVESGADFSIYKFHRQSNSTWSTFWLIGCWSSWFVLTKNIYDQSFREIESRYNVSTAIIGAITWYIIGAIGKPKDWKP